jgi:L-serine dehydratase
MSLSIFDIFSVGIGPSSSHTVGPMKAVHAFLTEVVKKKKFKEIDTLKCDFYGSLALTGKGHGSDKAVILGAHGHTPETIDSDEIPNYLDKNKKEKKVYAKFGRNKHHIKLDPKKDIKFHRRVSLPFHPNGMAFAVFDKKGNEIHRAIYYSIGGGFVLTEEEAKANEFPETAIKLKYPFSSGAELLDQCQKHNLNIAELMLANETAFQAEKKVIKNTLEIWKYMEGCINRGLKNEGILPGGLKVERRAPGVYKKLLHNPEKNFLDSLTILDWVNLYALAVNEENAAGGIVVTAPTNGAAGIIPAVLQYYIKFCPGSNEKGIIDFLLVAGAIAILYKTNASISGAEVGCQGEVGVACSMAAGALAHVLGATVKQVENAAEIGMEHNLGLTCDPIGGLVQIPCIERNAMGAIKAINAARIALRGDGKNKVSLDKVIKTMKDTGKDMKKHYKETSRGGLAVNVTEC